MNEQLQRFARDTIKAGLAKLTDGNRGLFKRMYSHKNLDADINDVVEAMDEEKLDTAMQQVARTLEKNNAL